MTQTCAKVPSAVLVCCRCSWKLKSNFVSGVYAGVIFSPTAIALGSSAIGKVWGQNRFRTLYGSGAGPSWAAQKVPRKVPPIPLQFQQGFNRGVSGPLGQTGLGLSKGSAFSRLTHTPPVRRKRPIMSLLLGYSLGLFNGIIRNNVSLFYS